MNSDFDGCKKKEEPYDPSLILIELIEILNNFRYRTDHRIVLFKC